MTKAKINISVVIPTHKGYKDVCNAIDSLLSQSIKVNEIIVVDNASEENISSKINKKYRNKKIKTIRLKDNEGVTGGRNTGIRNVTTNFDYILFFDHDMTAEKDMLENMLKTLERNKKAGIITPKILYKKHKDIIWSAGTDINLTTGKVIFHGGKDAGQYDKDRKVAVAPAVMLVRRELIEKLGGFDDRYFATYEDTDFCFRALEHGFETYYSALAVAYHNIPRDIKGDAERLIERGYWVARNRILFMNDFGNNFLIFLLLIPLYSLYYTLLALKTSKLNKINKYYLGIVNGLALVFKQRCLKYIPFTYHWILRESIGDTKSIIDIGCGDGALMRDISIGENIVGIDIYEESVQLAKSTNVYKKAYVADVLKIKKLNLKPADVVFSSQVVEHLEKKKAIEAIKYWQSLAKKKVVIGTTNGYIDFEPIEDKIDENPYQEHQSGWTKDDFEELGFKVHGQGLKLIYGEKGLARKTSSKIMPLWSIFAFLFSPIVYYNPGLAMYLIAVKKV